MYFIQDNRQILLKLMWLSSTFSVCCSNLLKEINQTTYSCNSFRSFGCRSVTEYKVVGRLTCYLLNDFSLHLTQLPVHPSYVLLLKFVGSSFLGKFCSRNLVGGQLTECSFSVFVVSQYENMSPTMFCKIVCLQMTY